MNLWIIFLTGLTVGGLTCLALQGGLLASVITAREKEDLQKGKQRKHNIFPILFFLAAKLLVYIILGGLLGAFGGILNISPTVSVIMQFVAGLYMIAIACNLLNLHPIFRYAIIQPPHFLARMVRNQAKSKDLFAPVLLGAMTVFIPCGTTLAMEALAISSGNFLIGAAVMAVFILGTMPLFFGIGFITSFLGDTFRNRFLKLAAVAVLYLGVSSANGALTAVGSPVTIQSIVDSLPFYVDLSRGEEQSGGDRVNVSVVDGVQVAQINILPNGYSPDYIKVKSGQPVRLNLKTTNGLGCTAVFRIPQFGITKTLDRNSSDSVVFLPDKPGKIVFTCSMGMYRGIIEAT